MVPVIKLNAVEMYFLRAIPLTLLNTVVVSVWVYAGPPTLYCEIKWVHVEGLEWHHKYLDFRRADAAIATKSLDCLNLKPPQLNSQL